MNPEETHTLSQVGGGAGPEPVVKSAATAPIMGYNMRCPAVKRLMREAAELANPESDYSAHPMESNLFEWHFTIRGPEGSEFEDGVYHGRIIFPTDYPMKPPSFILLTPNGRFQTEEKICLSISNYHPETWLPSWSIETALVALRSFMTTPGNEGAIGSLNFPPDERKKLATKSKGWSCRECGPIIKLLPAKAKDDSSSAKDKEESTEPKHSTTKPAPNQKDSANNGNVAKDKGLAKDSQTDVVSTSSTATNTDNQGATSLNSESAGATSVSEEQQAQQQQTEPIKNIIYDFGIGCFVVLILALCLRRLLAILLRL